MIYVETNDIFCYDYLYNILHKLSKKGSLCRKEFYYLGHQTLVNPISIFMSILDGTTYSAAIEYSAMISGANVAIVMRICDFDKFIDRSIYKLKDDNILIIIMFALTEFGWHAL